MALKKIDYKKFNLNFLHANTHEIYYTIYDGKTTLLSEFNQIEYDKKRIYGPVACFVNTLMHIRENNMFTIKYDVEADPEASVGGNIPVLDPIEVKKWFQITRKYKLLPKSIRYFSKNSSQYIILNTREWPISRIYMFLTTFRFVREDPGLVRAFVHLVDEVGIDPYVAFVAAHRFCTNAVGHSVIKEVKTYRDMLNGLTANATFKLSTARKLRKYVNDPWKYDKREVDNTSHTEYNLQQIIDKVYAGIITTAEIRLNQITHKNVTPFIYEEDKDKTYDLYKEIVET